MPVLFERLIVNTEIYIDIQWFVSQKRPLKNLVAFKNIKKIKMKTKSSKFRYMLYIWVYFIKFQKITK